MPKPSRGIAAVAILLSICSPSIGQEKQPFTYSFAVVSYACFEKSTTKSLNIYSQVFGACLIERNHAQIAHDQLYSAEQVAKTRCQNGSLKYEMVDVGYPYRGPHASDDAEKERTDHMNTNVKGGIAVDTFYVTPVYSGRCR